MSFNNRLIKQNIRELEEKLQIDSLKDFFVEKYNNEHLSVNNIAVLIYKNRKKTSTIYKYMDYFEIKKRAPGDSIRLTEINKIEKRLNISSFKKFLIKQYWDNKLGLSEIAEIVYSNKKNGPSILRWMKYFNIKRRSRSESVKLQYQGVKGKSRRKKSSLIAKTFLNSNETRKKLIIKMQTKEYKEKQRLSKLGEKNGMYGVIGENNPNWNPNKTRLQRQKDRKLNQNRIFVNSCLKRDAYKCQHCLTKGRKLNVHHLDGYSWCIDKRFNISNGVTLCEECHKKFHNIYGTRHSTKEQFLEFNLLSKK